MEHIELTPYFVDDKDYRIGRPRCDAQKLLKVIYFAFMERGNSSLRDIEKLCWNYIRFLYILVGMKAPSYITFEKFIRNEFTTSIEKFLKISTGTPGYGKNPALGTEIRCLKSFLHS